MGGLHWFKKVRDNERYGGLGQPTGGIQIFSHLDWKPYHVQRYAEMAAEAGYEVEVASELDSRINEDLHAEVGLKVKPSWWVTVWEPGEPKPRVVDELQNYVQWKRDHDED